MNLDVYCCRRADQSRSPHRGLFGRHLIGKVRAGLSRERWQVRPFGLLCLLTVVGLGGCQTTWSFDRPTAAIDNVPFMNLWKTYTHCRSSSDPDEIRIDAQRLGEAAHAVKLKSQSSIVLPAAMQHLISELPSRLAVDPKAMAMACALYGGQVARAVGRPRLAVELFNVVLAKQAEAAYGYYVFEASRGLEHMGPDNHLVMKTSVGIPGSIVEKTMEGYVDRVTLIEWRHRWIMPQMEQGAYAQQISRSYNNKSMMDQYGTGKDDMLLMSQTGVEPISSLGARCPASAPVRQYDISAINVEISLHWWVNFSYPGYMYVLTEHIEKVRKAEAKHREAGRKEQPDPGAVMNEPPGQWIQRLIMRGNPGDCVKISLRNQLEGGEEVSLHIDGANVVVPATGQPATTTNSDAIAGPGQSIDLEWYIHPSTQEGDRQFHSYSHERELTAAGLFGTFIVEPKGSASLDPLGSGEQTSLKSDLNLSQSDSQHEGR
jgi:hypothetical protein